MGISKLVFLDLDVVALGCFALAILALTRGGAKCPSLPFHQSSKFTVHTRGKISLPDLPATLSLSSVSEAFLRKETLASCDFCLWPGKQRYPAAVSAKNLTSAG